MVVFQDRILMAESLGEALEGIFGDIDFDTSRGRKATDKTYQLFGIPKKNKKEN